MSDTESNSATFDMDCDDEGTQMETDLTEQEIVIIAEQKKEEGNKLYKEKKFREASKLYSLAIDLYPSSVTYYGNRAAAFMMLSDFKNALIDCKSATNLDTSFVKGYVREGKCHTALGDPTAAINVYNRALSLDPSNKSVQDEIKIAENLQKLEQRLEKDLQKGGDTRRALFCINKCLETSSASVCYKLKKAEILSLLGKHTECHDLVLGILHTDSMNAEALYLRGVCLYYLDNLEKAFQHFQQVLRLSPDHNKSKIFYKKAKSLIQKKEEGNEAFRCGKLEEANRLYTEALAVDPDNKFINSKLFFNRATVLSKTGDLDAAIDDCTKAIELDDKYIKAYLRRAKCYMDREQYDEAVREYDAVCKMDKSAENCLLLKEAKLELKKSKRKDYYKILGVSKNATEDEIKKGYKKRALIHHPDRHSHAEPEVQKEEERRFKEVGEAYGVLSDTKKRRRYDNGQDLEDIENAGFDHIDPNLIFQSFFGGGGAPGGFSFSSSGFPRDGGQSFSFQFG